MVTRIDPYAGYNFSVELDGITRAGFRECSGLQNSQNAGTYREGTDRYLSPRKIPGLVTYGDITLGRGVTSDSKLWEWRQKAARGEVVRHNISITVLDDVGNAKITWNLFEAWPTSWTGPSLNATTDEFAIEQITIAYERLELDQWS
ncbi:phage tail protein [Frankia sp. CNm7]|uniref:Phage tail protein n=1 Tax=Frankia nepalensis TaxID=1836974 RepID=A0A937RH69_9ACTN|nr:phage tail protein [Frankia nepalensis]MBL7494820.1 phage tail protein [Frankia nepalensis]MBL7508969.1 phage tail protein [Frankia nepalensis]MBL7524799.1 phage tail protein [Frankia nepalensis]MBL7626303.1 phage tail protein [Frankia nepalensis]